MSSRSELRARIMDALDDEDNAQWEVARVNRVMDVKRRFAFTFQETLAPGRYFKSTEDLSIIADTQEYDLQDGVSAVAFVERIAENGTALDSPIPVTKIDFTERDQYQVVTTSNARGAVYYYTYWSLDNGLPMLKIGFAPTPQTTGEDFRVHEYVQPWELTDLAWDPTAGSGLTDDSNESGLIDLAEDLLVYQSVIELHAQKPSVSKQTADYWRAEEAKLLSLVQTKEGDSHEQDGPREVQMKDC